MTQPKKLFVDSNGNQLSFFFARGLPQGDTQRLIGLVENYGGSCSSRPEDADYVISDYLRIDDPSLKGYIAYYSSFITDCILSGRILENIHEYAIVEIPEDDEGGLGDGSSQADIGEYSDNFILDPAAVSKQPLQSSSSQTSSTRKRQLPWSLPRQQVRTPASSPLRVIPWQTIQQSQSQVLDEDDERTEERIELARGTTIKTHTSNHTRKRSHVSDSEEEETIHNQYVLRERKTSPSLSPPFSEPLSQKQLRSLTLKEQTSSRLNASLLPSSPVRPPTKRRKLNDAVSEIEVEFDYDRPQNDFDDETVSDFDEKTVSLDESGNDSNDEHEQLIQTKMPLFTDPKKTLFDFASVELSCHSQLKQKIINDQRSLCQEVDQLRQAYSVAPSIIFGLLHRTSFRLDIVNNVLLGYRGKGAEFELNRDIVGVFTIQDDEDLASKDPLAIERVQQRHGNALVAWRRRYWEIFMLLHQRERT
ncbi:hypothetical protein V1523DRAFT_401168 [Lipomyces doorenjongii]